MVILTVSVVVVVVVSTTTSVWIGPVGVVWPVVVAVAVVCGRVITGPHDPLLLGVLLRHCDVLRDLGWVLVRGLHAARSVDRRIVREEGSLTLSTTWIWCTGIHFVFLSI